MPPKPRSPDYSEEDKRYLQACYRILGVMSGMATQANFRATVAMYRGTPMSHEIVMRLKDSSIKPSAFVGLHTLAVCGDQIAGFSSGKGDERLTSELLSMVTEDLGAEACEHLKCMISGMKQAKNHELVEGDEWTKLGAMCEALDRIGRFRAYGKETFAEDGKWILTTIKGTRITAESCKGAIPVLDAVYEEEVQFLKNGMARAGVMRPPVPGGP